MGNRGLRREWRSRARRLRGDGNELLEPPLGLVVPADVSHLRRSSQAYLSRLIRRASMRDETETRAALLPSSLIIEGPASFDIHQNGLHRPLLQTLRVGGNSRDFMRARCQVQNRTLAMHA